jgi:hypothetical protein
MDMLYLYKLKFIAETVKRNLNPSPSKLIKERVMFPGKAPDKPGVDPG